MIELERRMSIAGPLEAVVVYLTDFGNAEQWDPGTKSCARMDAGPIQVGSRWRNVSEFRGRETELQYTLTRLEPRRLTFTGENKTVTTTDDLSFEPDGERTRIRYQASFDFKGLARLAQPLIKGALNKLGDDTVKQMESVVGKAVQT